MGQLFSAIRATFPPKPTLTEKNLPDQTGKVFIVTGGSSGVGEQLAYILYLHNAKVYIAARSEDKTSKAIERIKTRVSDSRGQLIFLHLNLDDLTTIKASSEAFLRENDRLDILFNNAGVMIPPQGSKTKQGYELQLGTNNVAPFLFTKLLHPILTKTARTAPEDSVRVLWVSSNAAELMSPRNGVEMDNLDYKDERPAWTKYGISKAGNVFHGSEFARRSRGEGIISVSLHPGALRTELGRYTPWWQLQLLKLIVHDPIFGAYTELWAGFSPEITASHNGASISPWGRINDGLRDDLVLAQRTEEEGGTGVARKFWEWTDEQVRPYL